jgi:hypothetical protein
MMYWVQRAVILQFVWQSFERAITLTDIAKRCQVNGVLLLKVNWRLLVQVPASRNYFKP